MTEHDGYRALAAAVLLRAVKDANGMIEPGIHRTKRKTLHQDAKAFLRKDNPTLRLYCEGIDIDPDAFVEAVRARGPEFVRVLRQAKSGRAEEKGA